MRSTEKMSSKGLVLLGFAESFSSPEVTWSLVDAGYTVVAFARKNSPAALLKSRHATVFEVTAPEDDAAATVREIDEAVDRLLATDDSAISLLLLDDAALWIQSHMRKDARLVSVGPSDVSIALHKDLQIEAARAAGFKVPNTVILRAEIDSSAPPLPFPFILKPVGAITSDGTRLTKGRFHICHNLTDFAAVAGTYPHDGSMMAQQYVTGVGEGLFGLGTAQGVLAWSAHRRLRMMNPLGSGSSACISVVPDPASEAAGAKLIQHADWRGPFMIELLRDEQGTVWFMEFNGRVWGSMALARRCGLEYPAWAVAASLNQAQPSPEIPPPPVGVICRHAGREIIHGLFVLRGPRSRSVAPWPSRGKTLWELLHFRRSEYWYNWRADDWRVFVGDIVTTIKSNVLKSRPKKQA